MDSLLDGQRHSYDSFQRGRSVHALPGVELEETIRAYHPEGRLECDDVPGEVGALASKAVERRLHDVRRAFPSASHAADWIYVEYTEKQYSTTHVDYPMDTMSGGPTKYAVVGIVVEACDAGGEFVVETCGDAHLWDGRMIRESANSHSDWFRALPKTRWQSSPRCGDALVWGTQVIHGTEPVRRGRSAKLLGFLF